MTILNYQKERLDTVDFLNTIDNPQRIRAILVNNNNIEPTDIAIFSRFINLETLKIGNDNFFITSFHMRNKFFGSFESLKNLTKLKVVCVDATDVDAGLEYLPFSLKGKKDCRENIYCNPWSENPSSPYNIPRCSVIREKLKKYNYDLEAWQLAHSHLIYKARPEIFFDSELKNKWLTALREKIANAQTKLIKFNDLKADKEPNYPNLPYFVMLTQRAKWNEERDKLLSSNPEKKISRLESKIRELKLIQDNISSHSLIENLQSKNVKQTENKTTQTEQMYLKK